MNNIGLSVGLVTLCVGVALFGLGGACFRIRAFANKRAWDGATKPLLLSGIVLIFISLPILYLTYPRLD